MRARCLLMQMPPSHPLLESTPLVLVEYHKNGELRVEKMPMTSLKLAKLRKGVRLAIIKGDRIGQDVNNPR